MSRSLLSNLCVPKEATQSKWLRTNLVSACKTKHSGNSQSIASQDRESYNQARRSGSQRIYKMICDARRRQTSTLRIDAVRSSLFLSSARLRNVHRGSTRITYVDQTRVSADANNEDDD